MRFSAYIDEIVLSLNLILALHILLEVISNFPSDLQGRFLVIVFLKVHAYHILLIHRDFTIYYLSYIFIFYVVIFIRPKSHKQLMHRIFKVVWINGSTIRRRTFLNINVFLLCVWGPWIFSVSATVLLWRGNLVFRQDGILRHIFILEAISIYHLAFSIDETFPLLIIFIDEVLNLELYSWWE